ncbi:MAG: Hint domain-containing protein [Paracoccaceae bacterium]
MPPLDATGGTLGGLAAPAFPPIPPGPVAAPDGARTRQGVPLAIDLLGQGADAAPLSVHGTPTSPHGTLAERGDGIWTFTPRPGFHGTTTVTYAVADARGVRGRIAFDLTVTPSRAAGAAPRCGTVPVCADPGPTLLCASVDPSCGTVAIEGADIVLTPAPGITGPVEIDYVSLDGARTITGTVTVTVDAPAAPVGGQAPAAGVTDPSLATTDDAREEAANDTAATVAPDPARRIGPRDAPSACSAPRAGPRGQVASPASAPHRDRATTPAPDRGVACFTAGTRIATERGEVAVEDLRVGDRILTRDSGLRPVRHVGIRAHRAEAVARSPALQPIRIAAGALGRGLPLRDLTVSPDHRILMTGPICDLYFGEVEVLVAARHLTGIPGIAPAPAGPVTYVHLLLDAHEIVQSDGAWSESLQPRDDMLRRLDPEARGGAQARRPGPGHRADRDAYPAARPALRRHEAALLVG